LSECSFECLFELDRSISIISDDVRSGRKPRMAVPHGSTGWNGTERDGAWLIEFGVQAMTDWMGVPRMKIRVKVDEEVER
jgi:hypothetical protein